jgi:hypothetical protein
MNDDIDNMTPPDEGILCSCGRSVESYPHWPPSTLPEAFDMLETQMQDNNTNHRYLATWWYRYVQQNEFCCKSGSIIEDIWENSKICASILILCPVISKDMMDEKNVGGLECKCQGRLKGRVCQDCFKYHGKGDCDHDHDEACPYYDEENLPHVFNLGTPDWLQEILDQGH